MGISGLLNQIGHGRRISLAKLSAEYYTANDRPFRLAIDISIWLFQIQSGKGGSNPALRTFYYRLLRLLSLNIHPLFVFDGPNKPLFKRNKKVGGPGVRVASVPEFLAKQLLKQFGFPWHVAPGEAEAECALLQRDGIVDAVLSEDVDTLMFGSGVTLRNFTAEKSGKTPTHVDVHREAETKASSGMDREGMILVALMSGGDYLPEGIPGCGPKVACDAARAGFGKDLCALRKGDRIGLDAWKERLLHEIRTNESKFFSRRSTTFTIPDDFPSREVLGFYTHPCVSTAEKLGRLRRELRWDQPLDFAALRSFAGDAFDWRCVGGAKKFIKNLAPALLIRELRLQGNEDQRLDLEAQEQMEKAYVQAIHGKRNSATTDGELEYRISIIPETLVPIDLSIEDEDDDIVPAGGIAEDDSDAESEVPAGTQGDTESDAPLSPTKKRNIRPYDPSQPEKLWILRPFLQVGCPLLVEEYEAAQKDPRQFLKQRRNARAAAKGDTNIHAKQKKAKKTRDKERAMPANALIAYTQVTKASSGRQLKELDSDFKSRSNSQVIQNDLSDSGLAAVAAFKLPSTQIQVEGSRPSSALPASQAIEILDLATTSTVRQPKAPSASVLARPFAAFAEKPKARKAATVRDSNGRITTIPQTPKRGSKKRPSADLSSPLSSQRMITSFYTPTPQKQTIDPLPLDNRPSLIDLLSSPIANQESSNGYRPLTPTPARAQRSLTRCSNSPPPSFLAFSPGKLSDNVTKRRKRSPLKRWKTEPANLQSLGEDENFASTEDKRRQTPILDDAFAMRSDRRRNSPSVEGFNAASPTSSDGSLASPSTFLSNQQRLSNGEGGIVLRDGECEDIDATPKASRQLVGARDSASAAATSKALLDSKLDASAVFAVRKLGPVPSDISDKKHQTSRHARPSQQDTGPCNTTRQIPPRQTVKRRIQIRESLEGAWKEVQAEEIDMTGDGSGWKRSGGRAQLSGWRKSGVDVVDLTGA